MARGRVGEAQSYLSDDQSEVFTDYRLSDPVILFDRRAETATPGLRRPIILTQRGGTILVQGRPFTESHAALLPLKPGTEVLCLLQRSGDKYRIVDWYYGVFEINSGVIKPLASRDDFASEFRGLPVQTVVQSMLALLQRSPGK